MNIFVSYMILGLSLAAPIGPVNATQLDKGIKYGFLQSWLVGLGAMVADGLFMLLIYFGSAHFLSTPFMKTFLWCFGCFVLIYTGIESFKHSVMIKDGAKDADEVAWKSFSSGFFITMTNPLSILFWLGIYGSILAKTAETYETWDLLYYSSGIFIGLFLWDIGMAATASLFHRYMKKAFLVLISRIAGLSLIGFGLYFGWQAALLLVL